MFRLEEAAHLLGRTPGILRAMFDGIADPWVSANEGGETWTARDVLAHVTELERSDWPVRLRVIMNEGPNGTFATVDRVRFRTTFASTSVSEMVAVFAKQRAANLAELQAFALGESDLERGAKHPSFGPVTLRQFLAAWTVHDLTHIAQITRVFAKRYSDEVGPWKQYLSVLRDRSE